MLLLPPRLRQAQATTMMMTMTMTSGLQRGGGSKQQGELTLLAFNTGKGVLLLTSLGNPSSRRSASPPPAQKESAPSGLPTFDDEEEDEDDIFGDGEGSIDRDPSAEDQEEAARLAALEYTEDGQPMGARGARSASPAGVATIASISLPHVAQRFTPSHMVRLPHFLRTAPSVYEREKYIDEREDAMVREKEEADADEKLRDVERRLRCDNTVRWKVDDNGNRISNSRFVKWSDGSWTLQVGNEQFDVSGFDARYAGSKGASTDHFQPGSSQSQPTQSDSQVKASTSRVPSQPLTYLATADPRSKMLQTLGPLYSNVSIQPASLQSATHRLISSNLSSLRARQAASKVTMSELVTGEKAPEEIKREREKKLLDEERKRRLRKKKEKGGDIEAEEEAELQSMLRGRRRGLIDAVGKSGKATGGARAGATGKRTAGSADEYEEDEGTYMEDDAEGFIVNDEEDDEDAEGEDEDEEQEEGADDEEEEEGETRSSSKKSKKNKKGDAMEVDGGEEELDEMEKAEQEIERQEAARVQAKKEAAAAAAASGGGEGVTQQRKSRPAVVDSDDE